MAATRPKPEQSRPWHRYQGKTGKFPWKLLAPGWGGSLGDDELVFIMEHLRRDEKLRLWWGIPPCWKSIPAEVIKRLAMAGQR
jgi:hypothetical protein